MSLITSPKFKRNVGKIIPFGVIWYLTGMSFLLSDTLATRNQNLNPGTDISLTVPVFIFASIAIFITGCLVGMIETLIVQKRFRGYSFLKKITFKFVLYLSLILIVISITYPVAAVLETGLGFTDGEIWDKTLRFFLSLSFVSTVLQLSFSLILCLIYSAISEHLGHSIFLNFFTGKYNEPIEEKRVFMFLDMKDSTTIAERLEHKTYFQLLRDYYDVMSDPIINRLGEVYQYIGDEVVISWKADQGFENNNCVACFFDIKENLRSKADAFQSKYGVAPGFKAGLHVGDVTTGEIGALKKEIVFTGDVLNTTARIQGLCKEHNCDLIISSEVCAGLEDKDKLVTTALGDYTLKGKLNTTSLFAVHEQVDRVIQPNSLKSQQA
ncbi:MAG: adenylate/guanylate cyclase domain-containing protein [Bacteroidota bacterium]